MNDTLDKVIEKYIVKHNIVNINPEDVSDTYARYILEKVIKSNLE
ncbi:hypothetical protein [Vallitalea okinawensis]|nr:hypothetical protein [Vallitalea okinawensis]